MADLGPADTIHHIVSRFHQALTSHDAGYLGAAQELYRLVFAPIVPFLGERRRLFLSPDGLLNLVPFAVLHDGVRFLVDAFDITYLTSGRDLLRHPEDSTPARSVVVFADPDFGQAPSLQATRTDPEAAAPALVPTERSLSVERFFLKQRAELGDAIWEALPGTRQEAEAIYKLLPYAKLILGQDATKTTFLQIAPPGILHVATHGFFLLPPRRGHPASQHPRSGHLR